MKRGILVAAGIGFAGGCSLFESLDDIRVGDGLDSGAGVPDARPDATGEPDAEAGGGDGDAACDGGCVVALTSGLVAYWKLDGDGTDSTGNGATLIAGTDAGPAVFMPGKIGDGLAPGIGTSFLCENCIWLARQGDARLATPGDFTISLWAKKSASPNTDNTWSHDTLVYDGQILLSAQASGPAPAPAYPTLGMIGAGGGYVGTVQDTTFDFRAAANEDVWTHVVAFRAGTTIGVRVDGRPAVTATFTGTVGTSNDFRVPQEINGYPWQGMVDEVGKWDRALNAAEIEALYNGGAGRTLP